MSLEIKADTTAKLINMSGKLRMLSHRICLFLSLCSNAEDEAQKQKFCEESQTAFDEFEKSYRHIIKIEQTAKASATLLQKLLFDKDKGVHVEVESFIAKVSNILTKNKRNHDVDRRELEELSLFTADRLLSILNQLTNAFQIDEENHNKMRRNQISEGLNQIESIGKRISLISFNAQIEAARAGEAGRGFSAISNEIQSLSAQTQTAAQSLRSVIK